MVFEYIACPFTNYLIVWLILMLILGQLITFNQYIFKNALRQIPNFEHMLEYYKNKGYFKNDELVDDIERSALYGSTEV